MELSARFLTDTEKVALLKASIANIGRLIPFGMTITFQRGQGATATVEQHFPDGEVLKATFTGYSPIYRVPTVAAEFGLESLGGEVGHG